MSLIHERTNAVQETFQRIRALNFGLDGHTQDQIDGARLAFLDLAKKDYLFPEHQFPYLYEHRSGFYRIGEDADHRNALYIQVSTNHSANSPHRHPYWAIITGVKGNETNVLYERVDDGAVSGRGKLRKIREVPIEKGVSLYIPREEFHTIHIDGGNSGVHLHFYGVGADTAEHRSVQRFKTPESEEVIVNQREGEPGQIGVQRVSLADVEEAQKYGHPIDTLLVDIIEESIPDAFSSSRRLNLSDIGPGLEDLPTNKATPIVVVGESKAVRIAAERLTRRGYFSTFWFDPTNPDVAQ